MKIRADELWKANIEIREHDLIRVILNFGVPYHFAVFDTVAPFGTPHESGGARYIFFPPRFSGERDHLVTRFAPHNALKLIA